MMFVSMNQKEEQRRLTGFHFYVRVPSRVSPQLQKALIQAPQIGADQPHQTPLLEDNQ